MRLTRLRVENFLSHRHTDIELPTQGVILLHGENGAGKSSLMDAIRFGLFGSKVGHITGLFNKGARSMSVQLSFTHGSNEYTVYRQYHLSKKKKEGENETAAATKVWITKNNTRLAEGVRETDKAIIRETGYTYDTFVNSVMAIQGQAYGLVDPDLTDNQRRDLLEHMFKIHTLRVVMEAANRAAADKTRELQSLLNVLEVRSLSHLKNKIEQFQREAQRLEQELQTAEARAQKLNADLEALEGDIKEAEGKLKEITEAEKTKAQNEAALEQINRQLREMKQEMAQLDKEIGSRPELEQEIEQLSAQNQKLVQLRQEHENLLEEQRLRERLNQLIEELENARQKSARLREIEPDVRLLERLEQELEKLRDRETTLKQEIAQAQARLDEAENLNREIERLQDEIGEEIRDPQDISARISQLKELLQGAHSDIGGAKQAKARLAKEMRDIEKIEGVCPRCKRPLDQEHKEKLLANIRDEMTQVESRLSQALSRAKEIEARMKKEQTHLEAALKAQEKKKHLESLRKRLTVLRKSQNQVGPLQEELQAISHKIANISREIKDLQAKRQEFFALKKFLDEKPEAQLEQEIENLQQQLKKSQENRVWPGKDIEEIAHMIQQLREVPKHLGSAEAKLAELEKKASKLRDLQAKQKHMREMARQLQQRISSVPQDISSTKQEIERRLEKLKASYNKTRQERETAVSQALILGEKLRNNSQETDKLQRGLSQATAYHRNAQLFSYIWDKLGKSGGLNRALEDRLRLLEMELQNHFQKFFSLGDFYVRLVGDEDLRVALIDQDGNVIYKLSGGQMVALGLAMRFALSLVLHGTEPESLFLDEPTPHLDDERVSQLQEILYSLKSHPGAPQILIVTHDDHLKSAADVVFNVYNRSGVSHVEQQDML